MNYAQLEQLWIDNGGNPAMAPIMAAIAMAESSGDPNNTTGDNGTSYGLWQIHWTVHPQFDPNQLTDPNYNAQAAIQLSGNGQYLQPWTTWQSYLAGAGHGYNVISQYLSPGTVPSSSPASAAAGTSSSSSATSTAGLAPWLADYQSIPVVGAATAQGVSIAIVAAFAITFFLIGGIWLIFGNQTSRTIVTNTAKTATKAAAAAA